ncbi:MAG: Cof-type HAD-IIB family hydrolase [Roseburia sp.]|nr:Cof-type HAD-IIB family hydrolase [Roseburia sp.]
MKKAVFFDIDGTLWNERMQIPQSTPDAVRALRASGHYAFLCSGRSRANIRTPKLLEIGFDGMVAACGADIEFQGESIFQKLMSQEEVEHALSVIGRHHISAVLEGPKYVYAKEEEFAGDPFITLLRKELDKDMKSIDQTTVYEVNKMSAATNGADIEAVRDELGDAFSVIVHNPKLIEIVPRGITKATGIQKLCGYLNIQRENTYAFGDSPNDLEMLEYVAHGIAMGNAGAAVRQAADYVTTDIMDDGIRNGLKYYGLIG